SADSPQDLADHTVILPTARACLALKQAFIRHMGHIGVDSAVLPKILPLKALAGQGADDDGSADDIGRQFLMARLIRASYPMPVASALKAAGQMLALYDEAVLNDADFSNLDKLDLQGLPSHLQSGARALGAIAESWPVLLEKAGIKDAALEYKNALDCLSFAPNTKVIAAGLLGQDLASRRLLRTILNHKNGSVIFPVVGDWPDQPLDQLTGHPCYFPLLALKFCGLAAGQVRPWPTDETHGIYAVHPYEIPDRGQLLKALAGRVLPDDFQDRDAARGIYMLEAENEYGQALAISLIAGQHLADPKASVLIVSPDRNLARIIGAALKRFGIDADDSAGVPLSLSPLGAAAMLMAKAAASPDDMAVLADLAARLLDEKTADSALLDFRKTRNMPPRWLEIKQRLAGLSAALHGGAGVDKVAGLHREALPPDTDPAVFDALDSLVENGGHIGEIKAADYEYVVAHAMSRFTVRSASQRHNVAVLGAIESRLLTADAVILAGFDDENWRQQPGQSPWLNMKGRAKLGLPDQDTVASLNWLDIASLMMAPKVYIARSVRCGGVVTRPDRLLVRLEALAKAGRITLYGAGAALDAARKLDAAPYRPCSPPQPAPPPESRPTSFSPSGLDKLLNDPYSYYCSRILKLEPLPPVDKSLDAADWGNAIHDILRQFLRQCPPGGNLELLQQIGYGHLKNQGFPMTARLVFDRLAAWFVRQEHRPVLLEEKLTAQLGQFTLAATIDRLDANGALIDYKTGAIPSKADAGRNRRAPQLPVESIIASASGHKVTAWQYWKLGRDCHISDVTADHKEWKDFLAETLAKFKTAPYPAIPTKISRFKDFQTLSRVFEWSVPSLDPDSGEEAQDAD
ncbi:MAG: PD-(D/E)XK nuclease family protein, partial [Alphaproteobacteria bacterium]|nr:PD-(D/E)XK nuclease family protein [Alphaproteobacteria bacterium]